MIQKEAEEGSSIVFSMEQHSDSANATKKPVQESETPATQESAAEAQDGIEHELQTLIKTETRPELGTPENNTGAGSSGSQSLIHDTKPQTTSDSANNTNNTKEAPMTSRERRSARAAERSQIRDNETPTGQVRSKSSERRNRASSRERPMRERSREGRRRSDSQERPSSSRNGLKDYVRRASSQERQRVRGRSQDGRSMGTSQEARSSRGVSQEDRRRGNSRVRSRSGQDIRTSSSHESTNSGEGISRRMGKGSFDSSGESNNTGSHQRQEARARRARSRSIRRSSSNSVHNPGDMAASAHTRSSQEPRMRGVSREGSRRMNRSHSASMHASTSMDTSAHRPQEPRRRERSRSIRRSTHNMNSSSSGPGMQKAMGDSSLSMSAGGSSKLGQQASARESRRRERSRSIIRRSTQSNSDLSAGGKMETSEHKSNTTKEEFRQRTTGHERSRERSRSTIRRSIQGTSDLPAGEMETSEHKSNTTKEEFRQRATSRDRRSRERSRSILRRSIHSTSDSSAGDMENSGHKSNTTNEEFRPRSRERRSLRSSRTSIQGSNSTGNQVEPESGSSHRRERSGDRRASKRQLEMYTAGDLNAAEDPSTYTEPRPSSSRDLSRRSFRTSEHSGIAGGSFRQSKTSITGPSCSSVMKSKSFHGVLGSSENNPGSSRPDRSVARSARVKDGSTNKSGHSTGNCSDDNSSINDSDEKSFFDEGDTPVKATMTMQYASGGPKATEVPNGAAGRKPAPREFRSMAMTQAKQADSILNFGADDWGCKPAKVAIDQERLSNVIVQVQPDTTAPTRDNFQAAPQIQNSSQVRSENRQSVTKPLSKYKLDEWDSDSSGDAGEADGKGGSGDAMVNSAHQGTQRRERRGLKGRRSKIGVNPAAQTTPGFDGATKPAVNGTIVLQPPPKGGNPVRDARRQKEKPKKKLSMEELLSRVDQAPADGKLSDDPEATPTIAIGPSDDVSAVTAKSKAKASAARTRRSRRALKGTNVF